MMFSLKSLFSSFLLRYIVQGVGIYYNYPVSSLTSSGYTVCYQATYATSTTSSDLSSCSGGASYFVGAISSAYPTIISVGAFGTSGIFTATYSTSVAYYDSQGAYWYDYPGKSFGFADNSAVTLNTCDTASTDCVSRLCWHLDQNVGGYRAGCTLGLNSDSTWTKVIYRYTGNPIPLPTPNPTSSPTQFPTPFPVLAPTVSPTGTLSIYICNFMYLTISNILF